jgi:nucleoside-diphosphate-sugar epimerase
MKKTLVTGASGFTGKALCRRLVAEGEHVVAFVRPTSKTRELRDMGVECRKVDLKNREDINDNFSGIGRVYHVAAAYRTEHTHVDEFHLVNVKATAYLLEAAMSAGVSRFVHCSTVGVHGEIEDPPADETYRVKPGDHYQESKLEGEILATRYFRKGLPGVVVRPVGIYGPGDSRFLKLFRSIDRGYFVMIGSGRVLYHLTYIDDLVEGIVLCGRKKEALGEVFIIAGPSYTTIGELVNLIADVLERPHPRWRVPFYPVYLASVLCEKICRPLGVVPPIYPRRVEFFQLDRAFTSEKARRLLGYEAKVDIREGLEKTASWYRERGLL